MSSENEEIDQLKDCLKKSMIYVKELRYNLESKFDDPDGELYDDGGIYHDIREIDELIKSIEEKL